MNLLNKTILIKMMNETPDYVVKYIHKFGLKGWDLTKRNKNKYKLIIVVPALKEFNNIKELLLSLSVNDNTYFDKTLIMFSINSLENAPQEIIDENEQTLVYLKSLIEKPSNADNPAETINNSGLNLAFVDITSPDKQMNIKDGGVGLARKIAMDLALNEFNYNVPGKNILVCLDADCKVSKNYITEIYNHFNNTNCSAAYVQFEHLIEGDEINKMAIICYEIFLRYYVLGLQIAESPFAIHTIGSTMCCDAEAYIKIQGMNKKKAAEDFYFMEKLSKNTKVSKIETSKVYPSSRESWRVPFGTGQRVNRFLSKQQNEYLLYSPQSFYLLKAWLKIFNNSEILNSQEYLEEAKTLNIELFNFLVINKFEENWNRILHNTKTKDQINIQKRYWFDGFRTLKFIHHLRDTVFPQKDMFNTLDEIFNEFDMKVVNLKGENIPTIDVQLEYLSVLRKLA